MANIFVTRPLADDMTVRDMMVYLEKYAKIQSPCATFSDWHVNPLNADKLLSDYRYTNGKDGYLRSHISLLATDEGDVLNISVTSKKWQTLQIGEFLNAGVFGFSYTHMAMLHKVINEMLSSNHLPLDVEFAEALPASPENMHGKSMCFLKTDLTLDVLVDGSQVAHYDFTENGVRDAYSGIKRHIEAWSSLAEKLHMINDGIEMSETSELDDSAVNSSTPRL